MCVVIKRDGTKVPFDKTKIQRAILNAYKEYYNDENCNYAEEIVDLIEEVVNSSEIEEITVEDIQDMVEDNLMEHDKIVAKLYIKYRYKHGMIRSCSADFVRLISEKLQASNVQNQNANIDEHSFGGRIGEATNEMMKQYALDYCMSEKSRNNHLNNEIYIHDLSAYAVGMHNCCARETKFCTSDNGVRSFLDYDDGDEVNVLTPFAENKKATVHKYGIQKLYKITFCLAGQRFLTERFTANHRWLLADGSETSQLKIGDKLLKAPVKIRDFSFENATEKEKYYWCLGFVLADGTEACHWSHGEKNEDIRFVRMRLCGNKTQYEPRFSNLKHSTKKLENGDLYLTFSSVIGFTKNFPNLKEMTRQEKLALFDGLYTADGQQAGSKKVLLTTNEQIASFIEDEAPSLGWYILNIKDKTGEKTNYQTRGFTKEYTFIGDDNKYYWTVIDIEEDKEEEVWCLDVEDTHAFVLPNGITTGNCLSIPFDKLLANGFNTRQTDIRPANSINTAFQLLAVIFQLQSLQQFGGVSATHLDWTMVPYVRKSFRKHYIDGLKYIENINDERLFQHIPMDAGIQDEEYKIYKGAYDYAMEMTERELQQAVEGMFHNLNTLQSRSGN